jgi:hypothetical protein
MELDFSEIDRCLELGEGERAAELLEALRAKAPGDPVVEDRTRRAALIAFRHELPREPYLPERRPAPEPRQVDLVYFHAAGTGEEDRSAEYFELLALACEAAMLRAPHAQRILLTDEATRVPEGLAVHKIVRCAIDTRRLMYERMRAQLAFLERRERRRPTVFLDADVVVNREPAAVFGEAFDVGLTWRIDIPESRFNGGVIFAAPGDRAGAFLQRALACYDALATDPRFDGEKVRSWGGDQYALASTVGHREFGRRETEGMVVGGSRVRFFPCDDYNVTMERRVPYSAQETRRKFFLHFKGDRKNLQKHYLDLVRKGVV